MNGVSILSALKAQPPQPALTAPGQVKLQSVSDATFLGQLHAVIEGQLNTAIQEWKGDSKDTRQENTGEDPKRPTAKKKDDASQQPVIVDAAPAQSRSPPVASFGLPAAGVDPGPDSGDAPKAKPESNSMTMTPMAAAVDAAHWAPTSILASPIKPPASQVEAVQPEPQMKLAFALRLVGRTSNSEPAAAPALPPPEIPLVSVDSAKPAAVVQPDGTAPPPQRTTLPTPTIAAVGTQAEKQGGSASEFGSNPGQGNAQDKEIAQGTPKPVQPRPSELKLQRTSSASPEPVIQAVKDSPLEAPTVNIGAAAPAPVTSSAQRDSNSPAAVSSIAQISTAPEPQVPVTAKSQVTDVSVNVPIPRPDASTDDRVAIRLVQNGAEVHVSVRTPDTQLAQSLRQDLGKLSTGLDQAGFHTETWRPTAANAAAQSNENPNREPSQGSPNRDGNGQSSGYGGQSNSGEQRRRQPHERPRWVAELEQQTNK